jgi:DNA polymerase I-like protein with 3'-5' exonuclease and polymerase domains|tara:strand:- start:10052 stop:11878 length:1827 start_codon:yes stop_codon:yes gene_type:complete
MRDISALDFETYSDDMTRQDTFAVDFETYYDKTCSIKTLGVLGYFSHPQFDAYMVSVVGSDGTEWVGHPKDFDWRRLDDQIVLSHNASFDETLYYYGVEQGWWAKCFPKEWHCTADLVAYCKLPRSLKGATAEAFDLTVDKATRDNMSGKRWEDMTVEFKEEVSEYALKDSVLCLRLWDEYESKWPTFERDISRTNRTIVQRGIPMDCDLLKTQLEIIKIQLFEAEENIPWLGEKPLLSRAAFNDQCRLVGIEPPVSLASTDEEAQEWIEFHQREHKWVDAVRNWRRINSLKKKLESFDYATMPDGRYYGGTMYFGAHTGRFSGSGGNLNLQNLPREEMFGVNLRNLIAPEPEKRLVVVDLSQIEVRTLCWLAKDGDMLKEIEESKDIYEAFAFRFGLITPPLELPFKENSKLRHAVKAMVLGCGYGAGPTRFASMANISEEEAEKQVNLYRSKMRKIKSLWYSYTGDIEGCYEANKQIDTPYTIDLPSGRVIDYGPLERRFEDGRNHYLASIPRHGKKIQVRLWGGLVAENASQALARDIFADMMLRVEKEGYKVIMHVHDELVVEIESEKAEEALKRIIEIMSVPPEWIPDIPLAAEGSILTKYEK